MENQKITMFNGKTHNISMAIFNIFQLVIYGIPMLVITSK